MARKNFGDDAWRDWVSRHDKLYEEPLLDRVWKLYEEGRDSLEAERDYLMRNRRRTEYDYAAEFGLIWPLTLPSSPFDASKIPASPRFRGLVAGRRTKQGRRIRATPLTPLVPPGVEAPAPTTQGTPPIHRGPDNSLPAPSRTTPGPTPTPPARKP